MLYILQACMMPLGQLWTRALGQIRHCMVESIKGKRGQKGPRANFAPGRLNAEAILADQSKPQQILSVILPSTLSRRGPGETAAHQEGL